MNRDYSLQPTQEDEKILAQFAATRDPQLREEIILRFLPLVYFVVGRLGISTQGHLEYDDFVSQGVLGLIAALDRYDPTYNTQFSTYAIPRVRGKILDHMRGQDWLSRTARQRAKQVQRASQALWKTLHRSPTEIEIAAHLDMPVEHVQQALVDSSSIFISLDTFSIWDNEEDISFHDVLPDEESPDPIEKLEESELELQLVAALRNLSEREQTILSLYYFEELTLKEIGAVIGVTESRVCQLHAKAILNLKAIMAENSDNRVPHKMVNHV